MARAPRPLIFDVPALLASLSINSTCAALNQAPPSTPNAQWTPISRISRSMQRTVPALQTGGPQEPSRSSPHCRETSQQHSIKSPAAKSSFRRGVSSWSSNTRTGEGNTAHRRACACHCTAGWCDRVQCVWQETSGLQGHTPGLALERESSKHPPKAGQRALCHAGRPCLPDPVLVFQWGSPVLIASAGCRARRCLPRVRGLTASGAGANPTRVLKLTGAEGQIVSGAPPVRAPGARVCRPWNPSWLGPAR